MIQRKSPCSSEITSSEVRARFTWTGSLAVRRYLERPVAGTKVRPGPRSRPMCPRGWVYSAAFSLFREALDTRGLSLAAKWFMSDFEPAIKIAFTELKTTFCPV